MGSMSANPNAFLTIPIFFLIFFLVISPKMAVDFLFTAFTMSSNAFLLSLIFFLSAFLSPLYRVIHPSISLKSVVCHLLFNKVYGFFKLSYLDVNLPYFFPKFAKRVRLLF